MAALLARLNGGDDPRLAAFARSFARRVRLEHHDDADVSRLAALIVGLFRLVDERRGELGVRVLNPSQERDGYATHGTIIQANTDDAPFLIDTVSEELRRHGLDVRLVLHPVMGIEREAGGAVTSVGPARGALHRESVMHFEVERRLPDDALAGLEADVTRVLRDVRLCVRDFHAMVDRVQRMIEFAEVATARYDRQEVTETVAFLHWLTADNYVFLGYR